MLERTKMVITHMFADYFNIFQLFDAGCKESFKLSLHVFRDHDCAMTTYLLCAMRVNMYQSIQMNAFKP